MESAASDEPRAIDLIPTVDLAQELLRRADLGCVVVIVQRRPGVYHQTILAPVDPDHRRTIYEQIEIAMHRRGAS